MINLFNLIPIMPLDGGRITAILSPKIWFLGVPVLIGTWLYQPSPMLVVIAIIAAPQLIRAWKYDSQSPEFEQYYNVKNSVKIEYACLYIILITVLALMII
ncbi:MAG: hypothetical protein ACKOAD_05745 [Gammaproteobacteria bacterium]